MNTLANYQSIRTSEGIKIFRYNTVFQSEKGSGSVIGLVYMMNPGDARPQSDELFKKLCTSEYKIKQPAITKPDNTMKKVMRLIEEAYESNNISLPEQYTIHVENLFNIREKKSSNAKRLAKNLQGIDHLMFSSRELEDSYQFVWLCWGNVHIQMERQKILRNKFPNAITVHKWNYRGEIRDVEYPVHPLYMNSDYFLEAAKGKII